METDPPSPQNINDSPINYHKPLPIPAKNRSATITLQRPNKAQPLSPSSRSLSMTTDTNSPQSSPKVDKKNSPSTLRLFHPRRPVRNCVALRDYMAGDSSEISFKEGEVIGLVETDKTPWGRGIKQNGSEGWFPMDFVSVLPPSPSNTMTMRKFRDSGSKLDLSSVIEHKQEYSSNLQKSLDHRPDKQELKDKHILESTAVDPSLHAAQKQLATKKKSDFLSNFLRSRKDKETHGVLSLTKEIIDFGGKTLEVKQSVFDEFEFRNNEISKLKWKIEVNSYNQPFLLSFDPPTGLLGKGKTQKIKVKIEVKNLITRDVSAHIVNTANSERISSFLVRIKSGESVFGVTPSGLDRIFDEEYNTMIPTILHLMKESLKKYDALKKEGIFRLAGEANLIATLRQKMDKKTFIDDPDIFSVATLLKVWYRELPEPVLQKISKDQLYTDDPVTCFQIVDSLPDPEHSLMKWLVMLIYETSSYSQYNKMTIENLAIVVSPNLYSVDASVNPVEGLVISQKTAKFFSNVLHGYTKLVDSGSGELPWKGPGAPTRRTSSGTISNVVRNDISFDQSARADRSFTMY